MKNVYWRDSSTEGWEEGLAGFKEIPEGAYRLPIEWDEQTQKWWRKRSGWFSRDYRLEVFGKLRITGEKVRLRLCRSSNQYYGLNIFDENDKVIRRYYGRNWREFSNSIQNGENYDWRKI
jgi:hypothetical protein